MNVDEAADLAWAAVEEGRRPPEALFGAITVDQAYEVQFRLLERHRARGETLAGWKIGGNSAFGRKMFADKAPFSGFLLASGAYPAGQSFTLSELPGPALIESELCVTLKSPLSGDAVTRDQVFAAIGSICASYEVAVSQLGAPVDLAQLCADNSAQWGYVLGQDLPFDRDFDFTAVETTALRSGETFETAIARDKVDDQVESIIWLARHLHRMGHAIEAGHRIMSGACLTPAQLRSGDRWETTFEGRASVSASFV